MELEFVILDDNKKYCIINEIIYNNIKYLYLTNIENIDDFTIRKEINNEFVGLDNEEEFNKVVDIFIKKITDNSEI